MLRVIAVAEPYALVTIGEIVTRCCLRMILPNTLLARLDQKLWIQEG